MYEKEEIKKIDIFETLGIFLKVVKKYWFVMLLVVLASSGASFLYGKFTYAPVYQAEAAFSVNTTGNAVLGSGTVGLEQIKESLPYILKSDVMKNLVMDDLELSYFPATINLESKETVNMFTLKVSASDGQTAYRILESVIKNCPGASVYVLGKIAIEVLDNSGMPGAPVNAYGALHTLLAGAVMGALLCAGAALFYALTNHTIQSEEDLKKYLSLTCIARVPFITFKKRRKKIDKHILIHNNKVNHGFIESFRNIRTRVEREMHRLNAASIIVTSSVPGEGKSVIASNLALSLAEAGNRVVLVDLDLRHPSVAGTLGIEKDKEQGVSDILEKGIEAEEVLTYVEEWNLHVLTGGEPVSDPTGLLKADVVGNLISTLKEQFDYVILDTPPAAMLADASVIAKCADCALYVIKQDGALVERMAEGMDALAAAGITIIGAVLNGFEDPVGSYGGYSYGRYGRYGHYGSYTRYKGGQNNQKDYVEVD